MQGLLLTMTTSTNKEEIIFTQVMPPMPATVPQHDAEDTPAIANPTRPCGEVRYPRVFNPFAPEVQHILRHILQVDPQYLIQHSH